MTLMRPKGLRTWALNEQVAVAPDGDRESYVAHGKYPLRCCIPSCLKNDMRQRAKRENAPNMASWLRTIIYRAVQRPETWNPQTPVQQLNLEHAALRTASRADYRFYDTATALEKKYDKQELSQAWGVKSYELFSHPLSLPSYQGRHPAIPEHLLEQKYAETAYLRAVIDRCRALETPSMQPIDNRFEEAPRMRGCADDSFYDERNYPTPKQPTLPKGSPRPGSSQEWDAASELSRLPMIWQQWSAADPEGVRTLHQLRQLYQEMHRAEQAYARVRANLLRKKDADRNKAHKRAERDCLLWEAKKSWIGG